MPHLFSANSRTTKAPTALHPRTHLWQGLRQLLQPWLLAPPRLPLQPQTPLQQPLLQDGWADSRRSGAPPLPSRRTQLCETRIVPRNVSRASCAVVGQYIECSRVWGGASGGSYALKWMQEWGKIDYSSARNFSIAYDTNKQGVSISNTPGQNVDRYLIICINPNAAERRGLAKRVLLRVAHKQFANICG